MIRKLLITILFLHGLAHLTGYAKSLGYLEHLLLNVHIFLPEGLCWLAASAIFVIASFLLSYKNRKWIGFAISGVILSQSLIIYHWHYCGYSTFVNLFILAAVFAGIAKYRFERLQKSEVDKLLANHSFHKEEDEVSVTTLPPIVQKWITSSGALKAKKAHLAVISQKGQMKLKQGSKWIPYTATEYFDLVKPTFIWNVTAKLNSWLFFTGRDKLIKGKGWMQMRLFGAVKIADSTPESKTKSGSLIRFLAEMMWFPNAAMRPYLEWESLEPLRARAFLHTPGISVSGIFTFSENGDVISFEAERYMGSKKTAKKETWLITVSGYNTFNDIRIPSTSSVTWKLKTGDFTWLNLETLHVDLF
jgi:hypothetical protein